MKPSIALVLPFPMLAAWNPPQDPDLDSGTRPPPEQTCYDVAHYGLSLRVDPDTKSIAGTSRMRARLASPTNRIALDLDARLVVDAVRSGTKPLRYVHEKGRIFVEDVEAWARVGEHFSLEVDYHGVPREAPNPPWSGGFTWSKTASGAPWIATSCQGEGADLWWPVKDQPDDEPESMDITIEVPSTLVCASNGRLIRVEDTQPGWHAFVWHVSTPINAYSVALNIAPYTTIEGEHESVAGGKFPLVYYVLPENVEQGQRLFAEIRQHMTFFEDVFGPYPFRADKYGVAETPHLGMEHQTITAYGNRYSGNPWGADQGFDFLLHHEMAHEWWALAVTARNWNDFWIHEGIGTYAQALYAERLRGPQAYRQVMSEQRRGILNRGAVAPREPRSSQEMYFVRHWKDSPAGDIYSKGSWIVHSLRFLLGDDAFFKLLRRFAYPDPKLEARTDGAACRFTTTDELLAIAERESGRELDWFFELYLRQPHLPSLDARTVDGQLELAWVTPGDLPFPMPVEVELNGRRTRVELPNGKARVALEGAKEYTLDPDAWILRELPRRPKGQDEHK